MNLDEHIDNYIDFKKTVIILIIHELQNKKEERMQTIS